MKKTKLLIAVYMLFLLTSCSSLSDAGKVLRNEKKQSTDEFLVKKKGPLTQPPDFNTIPAPGSMEKKTKDDTANIFKRNKKSINKKNNKASSTENSILNHIKK